MGGRIFGVVVAWVIVLVVLWRGLAPGRWIHRQLYPPPQFAPAAAVRMGIEVTAEGICAEPMRDRDAAQIDLVFSLRRLDGRDWPDDPLLQVSLLVQGRRYRPSYGGTFSADGRPPFDTAVDLFTVRAGPGLDECSRPALRWRYLYRFEGLPHLWQDASLIVRLVREIPPPDFDLGTYDFVSRQVRSRKLLPGAGTVVSVRDIYQGPLPYNPKGGVVTRLDLREELPYELTAGPLRLDYPRWGVLVAQDDRGERLAGVRVYPRRPSFWGGGAGALYVLQVPADRRQPRSIAVQFISTDAMAADSIELIIPRLTTLDTAATLPANHSRPEPARRT